MKKILPILFVLLVGPLLAQSPIVGPTQVSSAIYFDKTPPLRELINAASRFDFAEGERNEDLHKPRLYPYAATASPQHGDPIAQQQMGSNSLITRNLLQSFEGQSGSSNPLDNNGSIGPNHYMQSINVTYAIYNRDGSTAVGPTAMNTLFAGVPGASHNDGDPIVMYDTQADRWFAAEFAGAYSNPDYMLIAISETNDPTGSWYRWSFTMNGFPDYMKFGITENSFLMGANSGGDDIYAFERSVMLAGGAAPQMVQFDNPNRPSSGFHVVLPMDTDGIFPPETTVGQFVTINDDAWDGTADELWVFDLDVDWANPNAATFQRTQQLAVPAFDADFGVSWDNITQPSTNQKLDAIPQILMTRAQHRVFGNTESTVCLHTVDVDQTDHAGLRWYELTRNIGGLWAVRQAGTYAPDGDSRWMGSIAQNNSHEISIGYNVSSSTTYPSIRYCGQSSDEYQNATGVMDYAETPIFEGTVSQTSSNRWGDYANIALDPLDDHSFWFTTSYVIAGNERGTKVASWNYSSPSVVAYFEADKVKACKYSMVQLTDKSVGDPTSWQWTISPSSYNFYDGTNANSQNPKIIFGSTGNYSITLTASNNESNDTRTEPDYISVFTLIADFAASSQTVVVGNGVTFTDASDCDPATWAWSFPGGTPSTFTGQNPPEIVYNTLGDYDVSLTVTKNGESVTELKQSYIHVIDCSYCDCSYINTIDEYINLVRFGDIDNSSNGEGYEDFTALSTNLEKGATVPITVGIAVGSDWDEYVKVWVDWNGDCSFSEDEGVDLGMTTTQGNHLLSGSLQVPDDAKFGQTRLRAVVQYNSIPSACDGGEFGGAEDYSVVVAGAPLPVELRSFIAYAKKATNSIEWVSETELNLSHFDVERSEDGTHFQRIGKVEAQGTSTSRVNYSLLDESPILTAYYRLNAIDIDGKAEYSDVVFVKRDAPEKNQVLGVFPNPVRDNLNIVISSTEDKKVMMRLVAANGQVMQMRQLVLHEGINKLNANVFLVPSGNYSLLIEGYSKAIQFVKK